MEREIYDNYDQEDQDYRAADHSIHSETMEQKDPAMNQHENESDRHTHVSDNTDYDTISNEKDKENDPSILTFKKMLPLRKI